MSANDQIKGDLERAIETLNLTLNWLLLLEAGADTAVPAQVIRRKIEGLLFDIAPKPATPYGWDKV